MSSFFVLHKTVKTHMINFMPKCPVNNKFIVIATISRAHFGQICPAETAFNKKK